MWYLTRPIEGGLVAFVFYLVMRAGFASVELGDLWAIVGVSAVVGMFSPQGVEKLRQIAESILTPRPSTSDPLVGVDQPKKPVIKAVDPVVLSKVQTDRGLIIRGTGFTASSRVLVGGTYRATENSNDRELRIILEPDDITASDGIDIVVDNGADGGESEPVNVSQ